MTFSICQFSKFLPALMIGFVDEVWASRFRVGAKSYIDRIDRRYEEDSFAKAALGRHLYLFAINNQSVVGERLEYTVRNMMV